LLIDTKLHIPELKRGMLERRHLLDRMSAEKDRPLVLVSGPVGVGKTSLICQWITRENLPATWYAIDETDNDPDIFFRYFLTALANIDDSLHAAVRPLLQNLKIVSTEDIIPTLIQALLTLKKDIYLVLDDFHHVSSKAIQDILRRLVQYLPPRLHIVIISRFNLDTLFSRLRIQGKTIDISGLDLALTEAEATAFFSDVVPINLSREKIRKLTQYLEGWVAGFQIIGLSEKSRSGGHDLEDMLSRASLGAMGYLMDEVINTLPEKIKQFLFKTAFLNRFNVPLAEEVAGVDNAGDMVDELNRKNLFLITLDKRQGWYRYHNLFLETIKDRVSILDPEMCTGVHRKAAVWFAENHYYEDAFQHAFASKNDEFAADLMEDYLLELYNMGESSAALRWIYRLPEDILLHRPLLKLFECGFKLEAFNTWGIDVVLGELERQKEKAFARYDTEKRNLCLDFFEYLKYAYQVAVDPGGAQDDVAAAVCKKIHLENSIFCASTKLLIGLNDLYKGKLNTAENNINDAAAIIFTSENLRARIACRRYLSMLSKSRGQLHQAESILMEGFEFLEQKGLGHIPLKLLLYFPVGEIYYDRNDIDKALEYLVISRKFAEQSGYFIDLLPCYHLLSGIYWDIGEHEKSLQYREKIQTVSRTIHIKSIKQMSEAQVCLLALRQGERGLAEKWARKRRFHVDEPFSLVYAVDGIAQACLLLQQGELEKAGLLFKSLLRRCNETGHMAFILYLDIFLSGTAYLQGDRRHARKYLENAVAFSETQGYIRPFVEAAPVILPILQEIYMDGNPQGEGSHLWVLIDACNNVKTDASYIENAVATGNDSGLTPREIDILKFMAAGYKDREIARKAFISLNTVKTHAKNIYKKLSVPGRLQAVSRARELGVFEGE
jgi:LuxR family transcriptional regulator, maltose regulon positive regulatory protein